MQRFSWHFAGTSYAGSPQRNTRDSRLHGVVVVVAAAARRQHSRCVQYGARLLCVPGECVSAVFVLIAAMRVASTNSRLVFRAAAVARAASLLAG